ncbi:proline dehydrogenase [Pedobacter sp. HMF7647]|uniref:Proline dehydrogenase n=1 Tax=Hufsiella arboris TaxID=2695275 RepID=A0A7K1YD64_9SPHI|nr:proline dehydrogenase family protein [Hufsiella arboris]MXV52039.1 proline dehydrogenase [Hufsiella arboris]
MVENVSDPEVGQSAKLNFDNTEIAFKGKSPAEMERAYWLFKIISSNFLTKIGPSITNTALKIGLPIVPLIKSTIFSQFCGGETIGECEHTINQLAEGHVGTILDYSVEGEEDERVFIETADEIIKTIKRAKGDKKVPLTVFKITGVGRFGILEKLDSEGELNNSEQVEWIKLKGRVSMICQAAYESDVPVMIDAEESWIQKTIDQLAVDMMRRYNRDRAIVLNTYQLYRHDKLQSLKDDIQFAISNGFILGAKIVRGAYMEKERKRAAEIGYPSPIQPDKEATDRDYNLAVQACMENLEHVAFVAGTHNENSCKLLAELADKLSVRHNHPNIFFSQLLGMSDNLSFNLSHAGYNVAKYVPYGPVKAVLPYLFRRAQENTSIAGQTSRELGLIIKEKKRRSGRS